MEYKKIGEFVQSEDGVILRIEEDDDYDVCFGCYFLKSRGCTMDSDFANCSPGFRRDRKGIIYRKVGEVK